MGVDDGDSEAPNICWRLQLKAGLGEAPLVSPGDAGLGPPPPLHAVGFWPRPSQQRPLVAPCSPVGWRKNQVDKEAFRRGRPGVWPKGRT